MSDSTEIISTETASASTFNAEEQAAWNAQFEPDTAAEPATTEAAAEEVVDPDDIVEEAAAPEEAAQQGKVPYGALKAERERRKAIEAEAAELRTRQAVLEDRWRTIQALQAQQQEQAKPAVAEDPEPDPNEDFIAHAQWTARELKRVQAAMTARQQAEQQTAQQTAQEQEIWSTWVSDAQAYSAENPEFPKAAEYLSEVRSRALALDPRFSDPVVRNKQIDNELKGLVAEAKRIGMRPAQMVHEYAKVYGFQAQATPPATPTAPPELPPQLKKVQEAQTASKSLSQAGGAASASLSMADLASMPAAEYRRWAAKPENQRLFQKLMGG